MLTMVRDVAVDLGRGRAHRPLGGHGNRCHACLSTTDRAAARALHFRGLDLKDATLMLLAESAAYPALAGAAQSAYTALAGGQQVQYQTLSELLGDASGPVRPAR
jgi:hypothetical protein